MACLQDPAQETVARLADGLPAPNEEQSLALATLNGYRQIHGLEPANMDRRLIASATIVADFMARSGSMGNKPARAEAQDALTRAMSFGYVNGISELLASGLRDAPNAVVRFVDAPYHRRLVLKPGHFDFGCATNAGFTCLVLGGMPDEKVVFSPPDGATGVTPEWDGREDPSPMRGTGIKAPYGYPVMISAYGESPDFVLTKATLKDAQGHAVACIVRSPSNDSEARNCAILVPKLPLAAKSVYTVTALYSVGGSQKSKTWSFETGNAAPVRAKKKKQ